MAAPNKSNPIEPKIDGVDDDPDNESHSSDNDFQDDDDDDDDDDPRNGIGRRGAPIKARGGSLQHASMTESYSEIMNSPSGSGDEGAVGGASGPYPIPRRRPGSLPTIEKNCKCWRRGRRLEPLRHWARLFK